MEKGRNTGTSEIKIRVEKSTEIAEPSLWKLINSAWTLWSFSGLVLGQLWSLDYLRVPGSTTRIYPCCRSYLIRVHSLWSDTLLRFNAEGRGFILPQTNMPNCVDSPWEPFLVERTEYFIFQIKIFKKE